jgi:hypothetical protein
VFYSLRFIKYIAKIDVSRYILVFTCRTIERERDWQNMMDVLLSLGGEYI